MPRGSKAASTEKQKRKAAPIEESDRQRGRSPRTAERLAWATVNKQDGGGKAGGSGRRRAGPTRNGGADGSPTERTTRAAARPARSRSRP